MVKILKVGINNSKKMLPVVDKPVVNYYLNQMKPIEKQINQTSNHDLFTGLKKGLEAVSNVIEKGGKFILKKREEYQLLLGTQRVIPSSTSCVSELKESISSMEKEVKQEKMLLSLEKRFRKGADGYGPPSGRKPFVLDELEPIVIDEKQKFEDEILRVTKIFISNSFKVDKSLISFSEVSKDFFKESSTSLREIYDIKDELLLKIAERIPFAGIIPKGLRVDEQIRLTKCIIKDYKDVTEKYITKGMTPYIDEYEKQYLTILDYALKNLETNSKEKLSQKCVDKIKETLDMRFKVASKLLEGFALGGKKIVDACNNVKENGKKEIVTKAIFSISGLF